jgi:hypothetical protein
MTLQAVTSWPASFPLTGPRLTQPARTIPVAVDKRCLATTVPQPDEIEAIAALTDVVQRNLQITLAYHNLTHAMALYLGRPNVSWCAYATWASKTAGSFIRGESITMAMQKYLKNADYIHQTVARLNRMVGWFANVTFDPFFFNSLLQQVNDEITINVAEGNLLVFAEMAPFYAHFIEAFVDSDAYDQAELDRFLVDHFTPGPVSTGGQDMLIAAFTYYYTAMFVAQRKLKAELILLANLLVGYHEQTRLQEAITGSMEAPLNLKIESAFLRRTQRWLAANTPAVMSGLLWMIWQKPLQKLARRLAAEWRAISTQRIMTLHLPAETLGLGRDVTPLPSGQMFPDELKVVEHAELRALLHELDRTPDTSQGSAAADWGCLPDRMNFVVDFFRSRQQDMRLYEQPFTLDQIMVIRAGGIPTGRL